MANYFKESIKKFKNDALSKGIYDIIKWLILLFLSIFTIKYIPYLKNLLSFEINITIYLLIILSIILIAATSIIVNVYFNQRIKAINRDNYVDELTGIKNHKALTEYLKNKMKEYVNKNESISIIILDIDNFKSFNTKFGYNVADQILKKVGQLLESDKRSTDETFRYFNRGDEFLVVANDTNLSQAMQAAERKRKLIYKSIFSVEGINHKLTVCCGVTELKISDDENSLKERAISALNEAKKISSKNNSISII